MDNDRLSSVRFFMEAMEEQKERVRALLCAIVEFLPEDNPTLKSLVDVAQRQHEDHTLWFEMQRCLGIDGEASVAPEREAR